MKKYLILIDPLHIIIVILSMIVLVRILISKPGKQAAQDTGLVQESGAYYLGGEAQPYIPDFTAQGELGVK